MSTIKPGDTVMRAEQNNGCTGAKVATVSIEDAKKTLEEAGYRVTPPPSKAELRAFLEEVLGYYTEAGPLTNNEVVLRSKLLELIDKAQF